MANVFREKRCSAYLKSGDLSERAIMQEIFNWVARAPRLKYRVFHIANEGKRTAFYGHGLKCQGLLPGVWDIQILGQKENYIGAWIEIKSAKGVLSDLQREFEDNIRPLGYYMQVCKKPEEAIDIIKWYCF